MKDFHRVGIIGASDIARKVFIPILDRMENCKIVALCSRTKETAIELGKEFSVKHVYDDLDEFLGRDDIDSVFVCTPTDTHLAIVSAALNKSKNVLVEKPLTTIEEQDFSLFELARSSSNTFYVAFNNNYREENIWLRKEVLAGALGDIELINFEWYRSQPFPRLGSHQGSKPSGILMHLGAKMLHVALSLIPDRSSFKAVCQNLNRSGGSLDEEDTSSASIIINEKISLNMRLGWNILLPVGSQTNFEVFGKKKKGSNSEYEGPGSDGYENMIVEFLNQSSSSQPMELDLVQDTMTLIHALYRSHQTKSPVSGKFA